MPTRPLILLVLLGCAVTPTDGALPVADEGGADETSTASSVGSTSGSSGASSDAACLCEPGEVVECDTFGNTKVCADDCETLVPGLCPDGTHCLDNRCLFEECEPGSVQCVDEGSYASCTGGGWSDPVPCADAEGCYLGQCLPLCTIAEIVPTSEGCSFLAATMLNGASLNPPDGLVVANATGDQTATVELTATLAAETWSLGLAATLEPGTAHTFLLDADEELPSQATTLGERVVYRVHSDVPVVAYLHSTFEAEWSNDGTALLPDHALGRRYVVASSTLAGVSSRVGYFDVIALSAGTTVRWTPPVATAGSEDVPAVAARNTGELELGALQHLRVINDDAGDLSGTLVEADGPIWVVGAHECADYWGWSSCDLVMEQMLSLSHWGDRYVATSPPEVPDGTVTGWRIFGGEDGVEITIDPPPPGAGGTLSLDLGEFADVVIDGNALMTGTGPFLPVQFVPDLWLDEFTDIDSSMVQGVPVEQFLSRYVFSTGAGYPYNYVQVTRSAGGAPVALNGTEVGGFIPIADEFEVANLPIVEGTHRVESDDPIGILVYGYEEYSGYAFAGGLSLEVLNPEG